MAINDRNFIITKSLRFNNSRSQNKNLGFKKQLIINKNLGVVTKKNIIDEYNKNFQENRKKLVLKLNENINTENILDNKEVLNKKIEVTTGKIAEFRDFGIYTINGDLIFSISNERLNVI